MIYILGIVVIVETVLLVGLHFHNRGYAGTIRVVKTPNGKMFSLELAGDPEDLEQENDVRFRVEREENMD